jgi:hypothetical protein
MSRLATVLTTLVVLAAVPTALAQPRPLKFPTSPPPTFVLVTGVDRDRGAVTIEFGNSVLVPVAVTREVEVNGKKVTEVVTEHVVETRVLRSELSLKSYRFLGRDGKEVGGDALWKRLAPGTMVLQQTGAQPVDAAFRRVMAAEALIVAPRQAGKQSAPKFVPAVPGS